MTEFVKYIREIVAKKVKSRECCFANNNFCSLEKSNTRDFAYINTKLDYVIVELTNLIFKIMFERHHKSILHGKNKKTVLILYANCLCVTDKVKLRSNMLTISMNSVLVKSNKIHSYEHYCFNFELFVCRVDTHIHISINILYIRIRIPLVLQ